MSAPVATGAPVSPFVCPRCGGAISVREGSRLGRCSHCRTSFLAQLPGGDLRFALPPSLDAREAGAKVRELLLGPDLPRDLSRRAVLQGVDLFFVPYWRIQATVVGRLRGTRKVLRRAWDPDRDRETGRLSLYGSSMQVARTETVDKPIREIWMATLSACPMDDLGVPTLSPLRQRSAGMQVTRRLGALRGVRFFDASLFRMGKVLDVMVPPETARRQANVLFRRFIDTRGFDVDRRELRFLRLQERRYLLYYPVYCIRFRYRGRIYRVTLDGHHGGLIHAHLPADPRNALAVVLGVTMVAALMTAAPLRLVLSPPEGLSELGRLTSDLRLWAVVAAGAAALVGGARYALEHLRFEADRVVHE